MQRNSDENLQDEGDAKAGNNRHEEYQSWRNGLVITKKEPPPARTEGWQSPEAKLNTLNFGKHMEQNVTVSEDLDRDDSASRLTSDRVRFANQREPGGQTNMHSQSLLTSNEKGKVTPLTHLLLYSEDVRISKILRRLLAEKSPSAAVDLCKKLDIAVRSPSNAAYICRSFELLLENMIAVLRQGPVECLEQASTTLGLIGYINRTNFPTYRNYLTKAYQSSRGLEKYIMMALKTTFSCDAVNLDLCIYCDSLLVVLKDYLENAVVAEIFIAVSETIAEFSKNYKREFADYFTDIVDIVVGWHLEVEQPHKLKMHCSQVLQYFSVYFIKELDFTFGLLGQFLEDIVSFGEDIAAETCSLKNKQKAEVRFGAFVGAFNTILKSLAMRTEFIAFTTGQAIIYEALVVIVETAKQTLSIFRSTSEETILNINDFLCLIFANCCNSVNLQDIDDLIQLQMQRLEHYNEQQKTSLLYLILCIVRQLRTQLPCSLVTAIFRVNSLDTIKLTKNERLYKLLLRIYHEVLIIKNVPLLQEAYKHITLHIDVAINTLAMAEPVSAEHQRAIAESTLNFYMAAISALATQTSSIIGMYALNPSILELLISSCKAANMDFWSQHSTLHSAILQMLVVHCQKNHNFMPTSRLLTEQHEKSSPTSENFSSVLKFLAEILVQHKKLCDNNLEILLKWLEGLLNACRESAHLLIENDHFVCICNSIAAAALKTPLICASCVETLLQYSTLNEETLQSFRDVSILLMDSFDPRVKQTYTVIFAKLPIRVSLAQSREQMSAIMERKQKLRELQQWYKATANFTHFRNKYFKPFLQSMELSAASAAERNFLSIFTKCWTMKARPDAVEFQQTVRGSSRLLSLWLEYEVARYCVRHKLRTAVGKPQDTFLAIEAIIMKCARRLTSKEGSAEDDFEAKSWENLVLAQRNISRLLAFVEELEKLIYNAAEGTAFAIVSPEKPAKTFFRINAHTCQEWFKRISSGINLIALHSMEYEMVIRFSENILKTDKLTDLRIDHTITSLVWALLSCEEANTLRGLYVWLRSKTGRRYAWIQHVAEHAARRREQAAEGYYTILHDDDAKMDSYTRDFLTDQLLDCLYSTGQWVKMREFLRVHKSTQQTSRLYNERSETHLNMIDALCFGQSDGSEGLLALTEWQIYEKDDEDGERNEEITTQSRGNFSYYNILRTLEDACFANSYSGAETPITQDMQAAIQAGVQESWRHGCILKRTSQQTEFILLNHIAQKLADGKANGAASCSTATLDCTQSVQQSCVLLKSLLWTLLFEERLHGHTDGTYSAAHHRLYLDVAASARSEGNANLCRIMLERFFALKGFTEPLLSISERMQNDVYIIDMADVDLLRGFSEVTKCMYASPRNNQLDAINLGSTYCYQIIQQLKLSEQPQYPDTSANMLLTLADWLATTVGSHSNANSVSSLVQLQRLLDSLPELPAHIKDDTSVAIPTTERAVGKLLNASIYQKNDSGEAWCAFGNWCYRWGKKVVEARNTDSFSSRSNISQRDLTTIKDILGEVVGEDEFKQLVNVLNSHPLNVSDGIEDLEASEDNSSITEMLEHELRKLDIFAHTSKQTIADIIGVWRQTHRNVYAYYELATRAYFKYLAIETAHTEHKQQQLPAHAVEDSTFVTTTLRILRLIVKHAIGLQEVLEEGLNTTPLRPWKVIIPQLFSRLNHHEPYVRKSVSDLLCRLAQNRPHLVIFPAVVGAQQELKLCSTASKDAAHLESHNEPGHEKTASTALSTSFSSLLQTLSQQAPETVLHVQLLVKELKRITLLWEEYWMHSLTQLCSDYAPLFGVLETEAKKCSDLAKLKLHYDILMKCLVGDLEKMATVSQKDAETNYERNFQERYGQFISSTISKLGTLPVDWSKPTEGWLRIKQLYSAFQQRAQRGSTMKISDLSPVLANMRDTTISMPGVDINEIHSVCIKSVESTVYVLPTKTKPKKLAFCGSDGRKYTYLFKGLEDLHLDERIMQFLSISNSMMARTNDPQCTTDCYKAHHYSVIPLGPQSGLISWVDGVTPLFAIYKKWQQRDAALKQQQKERSMAANTNQNAEQLSVPAATRPSELFYNKLTPLLAEQNIRVTDPRKQWPLATLRRVLEELSLETPRDLLSKELWCNAISASQWRKSVRSYAISVSVMSVIGYVIGLGDRHLDNVLIKLSTGEILHIDYNVCFEKGKTLRVPEKVPFRITPNLEEALGITGIEGTFRLGCEHVLKTLRKERETLLTLLEAFVYDPLVDWTVSDDSSSATAARTTSAQVAAQRINALNLPTTFGTNTATVRVASKSDELVQRKQDLETARQNITIKFNEIKPYWAKYKDEIHVKLLEINNEVEYLLANRQTIKQAEEERAILTKQLAMIHELEALGSARGSHALNTITQRYTAYKSAAAAFNGVKQSVRKYHSDIKNLIETYFEQLIESPLAANELVHLQMELSEHEQRVYANEFEVVCDFLDQSGQKELFEQCDFTRKEMDNSIYQETRTSMDCLELLLQYASVMQYYPRSHAQRNHLMRYEQWYGQLLDEQQDAVSLKQEVQQWLQSEAQGSQLKATLALQFSMEMEKIWIELNFELHQTVNALNEQKQQESLPIDVAVAAIQIFLTAAPELHEQALHLGLLRTLEQANVSFQRFEEAAVSSVDCHLLEQQIDFIDVLQSMCRSVFMSSLPEQNFAALQVLNSTLLSLQRLKSAFELPILERVLHLFMLDDEPETQTTLLVICTSPTSAQELLQAANTIPNDELRALLTHLFELFDDFEQNLQVLQRTAREIDVHTPEHDFSPYAKLQICNNNNLELFVGTTKFETIAQVFRMARDFVAALNESSTENVYDVRLLSAPISDYIHHMQNYLLSGLTSLFATSLHGDLSAAYYTGVHIDDGTLSNAEVLTGNLFAALQHNATLKNCQLQLLLRTKWVDHYTLVATAHFWANEEQLLRDNHTLYRHIVYKAKLLSSLQNASQSLSVWRHTLSKIQGDIKEHTANVFHLLGRLSAGSEQVQAVQASFAELTNSQQLRYEFHLKLVTKLTDLASMLLQFEVLRTGDSSLEADNAFLAILAQWQQTYSSWRQSGAVITAVEQNIVQMLDPEGKVDQCWIDNISGLLDDMTFNVHRKLVTLEQEEQMRQEHLYVAAKQLQPFSDAQLRIDIRHLLKMVSKIDKSAASVAVEAQHVRELQHGLKVFYAKLNDLQLQLMARDYSDAALCQIENTIAELLHANAQNHSELLQLLQRVVLSDKSSLVASGSCASSGDNKSSNPPNAGMSTCDKKVVANQSEQKRNAYAVSVWKRIRMKLEGRDPDPNCRSTVAEQVEFIIREATNPDNLAVLYEGWTPWV